MVARGLAFDIGKHASERGIVPEEKTAHVDQSFHLVRRQVEVSADTVELLAHPLLQEVDCISYTRAAALAYRAMVAYPVPLRSSACKSQPIRPTNSILSRTTAACARVILARLEHLPYCGESLLDNCGVALIALHVNCGVVGQIFRA
jgi:hypothetical protein